ncbi:MAG: DNA polymerase III subunit alpha [Chloroflexi bacterium]|nr:DNA polymerase III subunit alpha [Chloroflexota bacterium]
MSYIPLRARSHWSLLDGVPSVPELVGHASALELPALALTDHNALYGAVEFVRKCRSAGIRPLVGAELSIHGGHSLVLLARDATGYGNLCRLVTRMQAATDREAAIERGLSLTELDAHRSGLVALSGGHGGPVDSHLRDGDSRNAELIARALAELFGRDGFYIELQIAEPGDEALASALDEMAGRLGVRAVATHDARYLLSADAPRYALLSAMRLGQRLADLPPQADYAWAPPDEIARRFSAFPAALAATAEVAGLCGDVLTLGTTRFPTLDLPSGRTPEDELCALVWDGARERYVAFGEPVEARLQMETQVINSLGYAPYFLVVADIVGFARRRGVPISPRGSASSSVAAYCLGIHDVDPLAHNLYFERFLSLERNDPPDIDLDLCSRRRDEVIAYVYERYGADHVAMVCTYSTMRPRSALREAAKAHGLSEQRIGELAREVPWYWPGSSRAEIEMAQTRLRKQARDAAERAAIEASITLEHTPHHLSIHPGGIVIAPGPITDLVPLQHATKGLAITQYDLGGIEQLGLVKIDLLGISALTVIADCVELVRQREPDFALEAIPAGDDATARTLSAGRTIGCFQIESPGMRATLREVSARNAADLIVALALYRPGPLKGGLKDAFVRRHLRQEPASYLHPALEPILRETYGVVLYQEQVLRIAHEVAGMTLGQADLLRRAMGKRSPEAMARLKAEFLRGAREAGGFDASVAEQVWELMAAFAGYGFPKAHAAGYATVAYRMAYLKTHFPAEFIAARLGVWGGFYSPRVYVGEARRLGMAVHPPHVNHSGAAFTLMHDATGQAHVYMGLDAVRELTRATIRRIIGGRPYATLEDFLIRAQPQHVEAINLVQAGALEGLGATMAMLAALDTQHWHGRHAAQLRLPIELPDADAAPEPDLTQRVAWEREVLGQTVSMHPLDLVGAELARVTRERSDELERRVGETVTLAGARITAHDVPYARQPALWLDLEDEAGAYLAVLEGATYRRFKPLAQSREPLLVRGRVRRDIHGLIVVAVESLQRISNATTDVPSRHSRGRR